MNVQLQQVLEDLAAITDGYFWVALSNLGQFDPDELLDAYDEVEDGSVEKYILKLYLSFNPVSQPVVPPTPPPPAVDE